MKILAFAVLLLGAVVEVASAESAARPNFIVIFSDDHTFRAIGYENNEVLTPHLDRLAKEGLIFERTYVAAPICASSRASIMTGVYPVEHGCVGLYGKGFVKSVIEEKRFATLPALLSRAGYRTAFWGKSHLSDPLDYGFQEGASDGEVNDEDLFARANAFLDRDDLSEKPFLLWLAPRNPHLPLFAPQRFHDLYKDASITLPENFRESPISSSLFNQGPPGVISFRDTNYVRTQSGVRAGPPRTADEMRRFIKDYFADISYLDEQIGAFADRLKQTPHYERTILIYLSDNGYFLGNHGLGNKITMHEESVRVPMFVHSPLLSRHGERVPGLVSSLDIAPTLLDLAGIPIPDHLRGRSLRPLLDDPQKTLREFVVSECVGPPENRPGFGHRMVRSDRWKYILSDANEEALYDEQEDPFELVNRVNDPAVRDTLNEHRAELRLWMAEVGDTHPLPPDGSQHDSPEKR